jgi:ergothioneine biosynthesis protein EgtB
MNQLINQFIETRKYTEQIFKPLAIEEYLAQPVEFVSPPKWSLGHTTWFFEIFILDKYDNDYTLFNPDFPFLFNSYYNNAGDRVVRNKRGDLSRPLVSEVYAYRDFVSKAMISFLEKDIADEVKNLVELGIQHEQQHQELFWTDLKYSCSLDPFFPAYNGKLPFSDEPENANRDFIKIKEGVYKAGFTGKGFCYDNELDYHKTYIQDFEIAKNIVTNAEFIDFINDGGYKNFNLWHDEAWKWINDHNVFAPLYWMLKDGKWMNYTLKGLHPVEKKKAVKHISFYEAFAFAEWKGMRLPTEFEWEVASDQFDWGKRWEWTNSAYLPYPGYSKAEGAVGEYNGKFMVSQMVLRGASIATTAGHSRKTYRNFFHPWERWQFTGLRLVKK